jgi:hypothetical protein
MSYKPDEQQWMAYLYGEMDEGDKRAFEEYLQRNPEAGAALEKWLNLRRMLTEAEDKEVIAPPLFIGNDATPRERIRQIWWHAPYFKTVVGIAASLILIILAAKLTGMRLSVSQNELRLAFGQEKATQAVQPVPSLTADQVQDMINSSLSQNNSQVQTSLEETQKKLDESIRKNLAVTSGKIDRLLHEASAASQQEIASYVANIRAENMQQVKDYFQLTSTEQKKYIENLLVDFAKYLQQQRSNDLQVVQTQMKSLEQNTNLFKQETEQILSSIITTVGTPVSKETKN